MPDDIQRLINHTRFENAYQKFLQALIKRLEKHMQTMLEADKEATLGSEDLHGLSPKEQARKTLLMQLDSVVDREQGKEATLEEAHEILDQDE